MLKTFVRLLGESAPAWRRYLLMTVLYGVFSGLTISTLAPLMLHLLNSEIRAASAWLAVLAAGMTLCWAWRRQVEQAGISLAVAVLQGGRQHIGARWHSCHWLVHPRQHRTARACDYPGHDGRGPTAGPCDHALISGSVTPLVLLVALFTLHPPLGLVALLALPALAAVLLFSARLGHRADQAFHQYFAAASQRMVEFAQAQSVLRASVGRVVAHGCWRKAWSVSAAAAWA